MNAGIILKLPPFLPQKKYDCGGAGVGIRIKKQKNQEKKLLRKNIHT
jgi:hypothetical protein